MIVDESDELSVGAAGQRGRVMQTFGLYAHVVDQSGNIHRCVIRRLLKSMASDGRSVVVPGDWVWFRGETSTQEGMVLKVETRQKCLKRCYRQSEHIIVANVDQVMLVTSVLQPALKTHLIDRMLISAEIGSLDAIICLNKVDLIDPLAIQPIVGLYSQLGYRTILTSTKSGLGIPELRECLSGHESVFVGQSGVGKSSLLNALDQHLNLKVRRVSEMNDKGRHTTTTAQFYDLATGGTVVDTPGVRQFELWDLPHHQPAAYFRELNTFLGACKFPDCTHREESACAIRNAVDANMISGTRYDSYRKIFEEFEERAANQHH